MCTRWATPRKYAEYCDYDLVCALVRIMLPCGGMNMKERMRKQYKERSAADERSTDRDHSSTFWSETPRGMRARDRWARRYDGLNGAPESDSDR